MTDLLNLLLISLITSLQIVFIHILFWPGMILEFMRENRLPLLVQKPLYECVICMTSFWGFLFWLFEWNMSVNLIQFWFVVGGINVLLSGIIGRAEDVNGEMFVENNKDKKHREYSKELDKRFENVTDSKFKEDLRDWMVKHGFDPVYFTAYQYKQFSDQYFASL